DEHRERGQRGRSGVLPCECHRDHLLPRACSPRARRAASGLSRTAISARTDAPRHAGGDPDAMALDHDSLHELWRLQLLDELRRRRVAFEYEPQLDPEGRRRAALAVLIASVEDVEGTALQELNGKDEAPIDAPPRKGEVMRPSILVAYASKKGSTAEVAAFVGKRLRER